MNKDIFASNINVEQLAELKINSEKLYRYNAGELDDRKREIICKRYGVRNIDGSLCKPMTQREIAKKLGISRSYISRIEKKALTKLNKRFTEPYDI
ncbi:MAG: sigma-70 family RNA polymerase sigma factor [Oscillospiraceae bacterium]